MMRSRRGQRPGRARGRRHSCPCAGLVPGARAPASRPTRSSSRLVSCRSSPRRATTSPRRARRTRTRSSSPPPARRPSSRPRRCRSRSCATASAARRARSARAAQAPDGTYDVYRPYWATDVGRGRPNPPLPRCASSRAANPNIAQAVIDRPHAARPADPRPEGDGQRRAGPAATARKPGDPLLGHPARARVDRRRARPPAHALRTSTTTARTPTRARPSRSSSTRASCGSSRSPTPTATTSPSRPATACGARTCATTTATAQITQRRRRRPQPQLRPTNWNYDDEGSSSDPASETYRGSGPASEPETQALDGLMKRIASGFQINYHSFAAAAALPVRLAGRDPVDRRPALRGAVGPDDDRRRPEPGAPGFDPDLCAELYTTNGETTDHAYTAVRHARRGRRRWRSDGDAPTAAASCSRTTRPTCRPSSRRTCRSRSTSRSRPTTRPTPSRTSATSRRTSCRRPFADLLRRPADGRGQRQARARPGRAALPGQRRPRRSRADTTRVPGRQRYGERRASTTTALRGEVTGTKPGDSVEVWFTAQARQALGARSPTTLASRHRQQGALLGGRGLHGPAARPSDPPAGPKYLDALQDGAAAERASATTSTTSTPGPHRARRARRAQPLQGGHLVHGRRPLIREPGQRPAARARRSSPTTRSSRSATTSTRAASSCHRPERATGAWDRFLYNPRGPAAVLQGNRRQAPADDGGQNCICRCLQRLPAVLAGGVRADRRWRSTTTRAPCRCSRRAGRSARRAFTLNGADSADNQEHTCTRS